MERNDRDWMDGMDEREREFVLKNMGAFEAGDPEDTASWLLQVGYISGLLERHSPVYGEWFEHYLHYFQ
ncbi:MAG: hypothetical protein ACP5G5_06545 [Thermoplasmata archaeon]|nr:MAG: hypothetical protein C0180_00960 [Aciduliprofundum sp.]